MATACLGLREVEETVHTLPGTCAPRVQCIGQYAVAEGDDCVWSSSERRRRADQTGAPAANVTPMSLAPRPRTCQDV